MLRYGTQAPQTERNNTKEASLLNVRIAQQVAFEVAPQEMGHRQRYVPGRQGFLLALSNSAALWHMSGAPWISVEWVQNSDRGSPREELPVAYLHLYLFIYVCTGASLMAQMVKNPSAMEET